VIDENGFRLNVGMILMNAQGQIFWGQRAGNPTAWQFPQGGINPGETESQAMHRELFEELGLYPEDVKIISKTENWLYYLLPERLSQKLLCVGQKQKWFLLKLLSDDSHVKLDLHPPPEFAQWRWVDYWLPLSAVIAFKREIYRQVLEQFEPWALVRE
jgi:putative (di)nucleoside polyphosphate hydrolase